MKLKYLLFIFALFSPLLLLAQAPPPSGSPPNIHAPIDDHAWFVAVASIGFVLWQHYRQRISNGIKRIYIKPPKLLK
jgi:hypothetical protein